MKRFFVCLFMAIMALTVSAEGYRVEYNAQTGQSLNFTIQVNASTVVIGQQTYSLRSLGSIYTLLRGIRDTSDWNYENRIAGANHLLDPHIETLFLPASPSLSAISSTLLRDLLKMRGNIEGLVP